MICMRKYLLFAVMWLVLKGELVSAYITTKLYNKLIRYNSL